jgi:prepilin signal peptidase PulO-like enzyme (type II secretory pathway)
VLVVLIGAVLGVLLGWGCWAVADRLTDAAPGGVRSPRAMGLLAAVGGGSLLVIAAQRSGGNVSVVVTVAILAAPLLITLLTDFRSRLVFPAVLIPGGLAALGIAATSPEGAQPALVSGGVAAAVTALLVVLSRWVWSSGETPLGSGDIFITAMIGAALGPEGAARALFAGMMFAAVAAGALLLTRRAERHGVIPYGAFLCAAALVGLALEGGR